MKEQLLEISLTFYLENIHKLSHDLPSVAMNILLLLMTSTMVSLHHQKQTMDVMMSQSYL